VELWKQRWCKRYKKCQCRGACGDEDARCCQKRYLEFLNEAADAKLPEEDRSHVIKLMTEANLASHDMSQAVLLKDGPVALHKRGWHWWLGVAEPCAALPQADLRRRAGMPPRVHAGYWLKDYRLNGRRFFALDEEGRERWATAENEPRGCELWDFSHGQPMWAMAAWYGLGGSWAAHWNMWKDQRGIAYEPSGAFAMVPQLRQSQVYPFPAYCARAAVSELSTVYNWELRPTNTASGVRDLFSSFKYDCGGIGEKEYKHVMKKTKRRAACWNFVYDWKVVICARYRGCECAGNNCTSDNIQCCRTAYSGFLDEHPDLKNLTAD